MDFYRTRVQETFIFNERIIILVIQDSFGDNTKQQKGYTAKFRAQAINSLGIGGKLRASKGTRLALRRKMQELAKKEIEEAANATRRKPVISKGPLNDQFPSGVAEWNRQMKLRKQAEEMRQRQVSDYQQALQRKRFEAQQRDQVAKKEWMEERVQALLRRPPSPETIGGTMWELSQSLTFEHRTEAWNLYVKFNSGMYNEGDRKKALTLMAEREYTWGATLY
jgi:hypothetical protein